MKLEDMQKMTEAELAYTVLCQLAGAQATLANLFSRRKAKDDKRWWFEAQDFMVQTHEEAAAQRAEKTASFRAAFCKVDEFAADLPTVVEKSIAIGAGPAEGNPGRDVEADKALMHERIRDRIVLGE